MRTVEVSSIGSPAPDYLIGPLTMEAVVELLYRAKAFSFGNVADAEYDINADERSVFEAIHYDNAPVDALYLTDDNFANIAWFESGTSFPPGEREAEIYKTTAGFYLRGRMFFQTSGLVDFANWDVDAPPSSDIGTCDIVLTSGTFPITGYITAGETSVTLTATAWWPYATTAAADAWNTTTGSAANGGPGA